jgi:hypothetical protein
MYVHHMLHHLLLICKAHALDTYRVSILLLQFMSLCSTTGKSEAVKPAEVDRHEQQRTHTL